MGRATFIAVTHCQHLPLLRCSDAFHPVDVGLLCKEATSHYRSSRTLGSFTPQPFQMSARDPPSDGKDTVGFSWPPMNITLLCWGEGLPVLGGTGPPAPSIPPVPPTPVAVSAISVFLADLVCSSFELPSIAFCLVVLLSSVIITDTQ